MIPRLRILILASLAAVCAGRHAAAQAAVSDAVACADSAPAPGSYARCALSIDGSHVRRGAEAVTIAGPGFFKPLRLTRVVVGDSALAYAAKFEKRSKQSGVLGLLAAGLWVASDIRARDACASGHVCHAFMGEGDDVAFGLLVGSLATLAISVPFQVSGRRAMSRAIWWHNARFAR
jgi:hypothetical protein